MTKLSALTDITSTDGTEDIYAIKAGVSQKINIDVITSRAVALVPSPPESVLFYVTTGDDTPTDLVSDGSGVYSGGNGLFLDAGYGFGVVGYELQIIGRSASGEHYYATAKNAASFNATGPTAALLATDTFTIVDASAGASSWAVATVVDTTNMQVYLSVTGAAAENVAWSVRLTPVRLQAAP